MCGRARCSLSREEIRAQARVDRWNNEEAYTPSYNLSPSRSTPVLKQGLPNQDRELHTMKWGLIPSYTKPDDSPDFFRMFNARSETVAEKGVFSKLLSRQRCIVFMNGFYEWKKEGTTKQPYFIFQDGQVAMRMAGLYDTWRTSTGETVYSFTILTTDSSEKLSWLHDRMPVILPDQAAIDIWLANKDTLSPGALKTLCVPYNAEDLQWFPVDPKMNSSRVDGPEVCQPLKRRPITAFFKSADVKKESPDKKGKPASYLPQSIKKDQNDIKSGSHVRDSEKEPTLSHAPDGAKLAIEDVSRLKTEAAVKSEPGEAEKLETNYGGADIKTEAARPLKTVAEDNASDAQKGQARGRTSDEQASPARKDLKRPGASPQGKQRNLKPRTAEKGKITSFFTKNPA